MCLAIPGKIQAIEYRYNGVVKVGKVSFGGIIKEVSLEMVPTAETGDYVIVHVGVAISKINETEAARVFEYLKAAGELNELNDSDVDNSAGT